MNFTRIQKQSKELEEFITSKSRDGKSDEVFVLITHLLAECGEVADEIKGMEGKRAEDPAQYSKDKLAKELVDVVFNALRIANHYGIELDNFWDKRLDGIKAKFQ